MWGREVHVAMVCPGKAALVCGCSDLILGRSRRNPKSLCNGEWDCRSMAKPCEKDPGSFRDKGEGGKDVSRGGGE